MAGGLLNTIHKAASVGWVYDSIQTVAGARLLESRLQKCLSGYTGRVLDIGGGTGKLSGLLPQTCTYACLDNEMPKLQRCAEQAPGWPILGDATQMPVQSGQIDVVTCVNVTHHLTADQFENMLRESARVLKPTGSLVLLDAVWKPSRLPGRILWALDRGASPKSEVELHGAIERHFQIEQWNHVAIYHKYVISVCRKKTGAVRYSNGTSSAGVRV